MWETQEENETNVFEWPQLLIKAHLSKTAEIACYYLGERERENA